MDVSTPTSKQLNTLRKFFHSMNRFMVWMWKRGWGKQINIWPEKMGRVMIIKHRGRKSGKEYLTPVNYAIVDGEIYCTAGFGSISDWYRNMLVNPQVELWLPDGKRAACAEDISDSPRRVFLLRQVLIASGFAASTFGGLDLRKINDEQFVEATKEYRLVCFKFLEVMSKTTFCHCEEGVARQSNLIYALQQAILHEIASPAGLATLAPDFLGKSCVRYSAVVTEPKAFLRQAL